MIGLNRARLIGASKLGKSGFRGICTAPIPQNRSLDVIRTDLARFFQDGFVLDESIYTDNLIFRIDINQHTITNSKYQYKILCSCVRWTARMSYSDIKLSLLSVKEDKLDMEGMELKYTLRWLFQGAPKVDSLPNEYEGIFVYLLSNGLVYEHRLTYINPIPSFVHTDWKVKVC